MFPPQNDYIDTVKDDGLQWLFIIVGTYQLVINIVLCFKFIKLSSFIFKMEVNVVQ